MGKRMAAGGLVAGLVASVAAVVGGGCAGGAGPARPDAAVHWIGEQHKAVHDGDIGAKVQLAELARQPHLFAVGPLAGLTGEITVLDGRPTIATVEGSGFRTQASLDHGAAFLAWAHVGEWNAKPLPESVRSLEDLAAFLPQAARAAGLDAASPLVFRIEGPVDTLAFHVLRPPASLPVTVAVHEQSKVHGSVGATAVRMVGFYSQRHRGVFTPGTSDVHVHFVQGDGALAGHVEGCTFARGAQLLLPAPAGH